MKRFIYMFVFFLTAIITFIVSNDVYAASNVKIGVNRITPGKKICASSSTFGNAHLYGWDYNSDQPISSWPGEVMTRNDDGYYCYTVQDGRTFDMVLFNNDYNAQTINLSTIMDDSNIINDYLYIFNTPYDGKYIGEWYVYDKTALTTLVNSTTSKIDDRYKYTKVTYNNLKNEYDNSNAIINYANPYDSADSPLVITKDDSSGGTLYSSKYVDAYNNLSNAIEGLKTRIPIVKNDSITTGTLTAKYVDEATSANYLVEIVASPVTGYKIDKVTAHAITGYNGNKPILGDEIQTSFVNNKYYAEFDENFSNDLKGIYINADFSKKVYKINFTVDKNGKVVYIKDGQEFDIFDVVEIEHGGNLLAKIIANEGYTLKSAKVNGSNITVNNNKFNISDIGADQTVEISFTLKNYTVSIDDKEYVFPHGTTYDQIIDAIKPSKEGYTFIGLTDKNKKRLSKDYKVVSNDTIYTLFRNDSDIVNPETGMNIIKVIFVFGFTITLLYVCGKSIERKKKLNK